MLTKNKRFICGLDDLVGEVGIIFESFWASLSGRMPEEGYSCNVVTGMESPSWVFLPLLNSSVKFLQQNESGRRAHSPVSANL